MIGLATQNAIQAQLNYIPTSSMPPALPAEALCELNLLGPWAEWMEAVNFHASADILERLTQPTKSPGAQICHPQSQGACIAFDSRPNQIICLTVLSVVFDQAILAGSSLA